MNTNLETFFQPKSVAVVGATDQRHKDGSKKPGQAICENILGSGYSGNIYFVNPSRETVLGVKTFTKLSALPEVPDLVVVVTPAATVPGITEECAKLGVPSEVIISAGFVEAGEKGKELAQEIKDIAARSGMNILGPNGVGVVGKNFNATFLTQPKVGPGNVALATQSGGVMCGLSDLSSGNGIGILKAASLGGMIGVSWKELIENFANDTDVNAIVLYMETVGDDPSGFLAAAQEASKKKLVIAMKGGKSAAAAQATLTHSGGLAGDNDVIMAAFRRVGILTARDKDELEWLLEWNKRKLPEGKRLSIVTNGGGPAILAVDELAQSGGVPAKLSDEMRAELLKILSPDPASPRAVSIGNTVDMMGDATPDMYEAAVKAALANTESDGVIVSFVPVAVVDAKDIAERVVPLLVNSEKPAAACFMGERSVGEAREVFRKAGIPVFSDPGIAARTFGRIAEKYLWLKEQEKMVEEKPHVGADSSERQDAEVLLKNIQSSGRTILTEYEAKTIFRAYGIPANETTIAKDEEDAVMKAEKFGYPVVLKIHSFTITHKTDVGGIELGLKSEQDVRSAFRRIHGAVDAKDFEGVNVQKMLDIKGTELLLGSKTDPSFGHVVVFGEGGTLAEYRKDTSIELVPLNYIRARALISQTKISQILMNGWRGSDPADMAQLENTLVVFSQFLENHPEIDSVDINPLIVSKDAIIALDARIILKK